MAKNYWTHTTLEMLASVKEVGAMPFVLYQYYLIVEFAEGKIKDSLKEAAAALGMVNNAVANLRTKLLAAKWIKQENGEILILKRFTKNEREHSQKMNISDKKPSQKMNISPPKSSQKMNISESEGSQKMNVGSQKMNVGSQKMNGTEVANIGIVLKRDLNQDLNQDKVSSIEETKLFDEPEKLPNFLARLSEPEIAELQKAICRVTYQARGAVKAISAAEWQNISEIFGFWVSFWKHTAATRLTKERGRAVLDRLRSTSKWTVEDIKNGIRGNAKSPHHNGANERGAIYNDLELICRTDQHLAVAFGFFENEPEPVKKKINGKQNNEPAGSNTGEQNNSNDDDELAFASVGARPKRTD